MNKKLSAIIMLYANLQYSEIPDAKIPALIDRSYQKVFDLISKRKKTKILLAISGYSLETLNKVNQKVLKQLKNLVKQKKIIIVGGTYSNPVLPLLPKDSRLRQIKKHKFLVKKYLNTRPVGFCPPEFGWTPLLSSDLKKVGYLWSIIPHHLIHFSKTLNELAMTKPKRRKYSAELAAKLLEKSWIRRLLYLPVIGWLFNQELSVINHSPFYISGTQSNIVGIPNIRTWSGYVLAALNDNYLQNPMKLKSHLRDQVKRGRGFFIPFLGDIENIEYGGNSPIVISIQNFAKFLDIFESAGFKIEAPQDYLRREKPKNLIYIKSGSGDPTGSFDMWTREPDNFVLEKICTEIRQKLEKTKNAKVRKKAGNYLMLAENADGRAWNPLPERRLACFKAAEKALEILEK